jgi:hypothetical protein
MTLLQRFILKHFILKIIWRKGANPGDPMLSWAAVAYRCANSFSRITMGEAGSASGAIAVK